MTSFLDQTIGRRRAHRCLSSLLVALLFGTPVSADAVAGVSERPLQSAQQAASTPLNDLATDAPAPAVSKAQIPDRPPEVIKNQAHFLVMDHTGLLPTQNACGFGLYSNDTRYLKNWDMQVNRHELTRLYGTTDRGYAARYLYGNKADESVDYELPEQKILVEREVVITDAVYEKIRLDNYDTRDRQVELAINFASDFADMFEVRGYGRKARGTMLTPEVNGSRREVILQYKGLDDGRLSTQILFSGIPPAALTGDRAVFRAKIAPRKAVELFVRIATAGGVTASPAAAFDGTVDAAVFDRQKALADRQYADWRARGAVISTDDADFNRLLERGYRDLYMLMQPTPRGNCIAAGIPWFCVAFGRDQEITSLETLPFLPELTRQTIDLLCAYQGEKDDNFTEEHPGRIMHELRLGEMARLKEIPFIPYYGTVDATPLLLVLLGDYVRWTGDIDFAAAHWKHVEKALAFLDREMMDGYLYYGKKKDAALSNQGWKDSGDSVMYGDGKLAKPPIALCEVQGYLYKAWLNASEIAHLLKNESRSKQLRRKADELQQRFQKDFWISDKRYVALALDGEGKQCSVVSSNPGHLLSTGILTPTQARLVADRLMQKDSFCGWGIRTLAGAEAAFNPLSYHNGSVWPHDNAMIVKGMGAINQTKYGAAVATALFRVAQQEPNRRLPELFCGFAYPEGPVWYPVACSPQAWAAGTMFMVLAGSLGLEPDALNHRLTISDPQLPKPLSRLEIKGLRIGKESVDLQFNRSHGKVECRVSAKPPALDVVFTNP